MVVLDFLGYCFRCMLGIFSIMLGRPTGNWQDNFVGIATLIVLIVIILAILYFTGIIRFGKK